MPEYNYRAIDDHGKSKKGTLVADTETHLEEILNEDGYYLLEASEIQAIVRSGIHKPEIVDSQEEEERGWQQGTKPPPGVKELHLHQHVYHGQGRAIAYNPDVSFGGGKLFLCLVCNWLTLSFLIGLGNILFLWGDKRYRNRAILAFGLALGTGFILLFLYLTIIGWLLIPIAIWLPLGMAIWMTIDAIKAYKKYS